jgi:two-component system sensor kinase FixL
MSWVTVIWSMGASACLTLAGLHLLVWLKQRRAWDHLLFVSSALAAALLAGFELTIMRAETPAQYGEIMRWAHVPFALLTISATWFVRLHLRAGRLWLAWSVTGFRILALVLTFVLNPNIHFRRITDVRPIPFLGEFVVVPVGEPNPWTLVGHLSLLLMLIFCIDATITVWRRGDRRQALVVGGSSVVFIALTLIQTVLVVWGVIQAPFFYSLTFLGIILAMGYELSGGVLQAAQLARGLQAAQTDLRESEQRMTLAADAAKMGFWLRDLARDEIWASDTWRELFGFTRSQQLDVVQFMQRVHPDDRESLRQALSAAVAAGSSYETEYRVLLPNGQIRWIGSHGGAERNAQGTPVRVRGVSVDITSRKQMEAETAQHQTELAHVARVAMMGQLASSLAHELNQPLGAILRNAEAAQLLLQSDPPDLEEIRAILADICADDQRAGAVIDHTRAMLKKRNLDAATLGVDELVEEVVALIRPDAAGRQVHMQIELAPQLAAVRGDRVQLQQVLLNLILNGMDAMIDVPAAERRLAVRARQIDGSTVEFEVSDSGPGIPADQFAHVFDPFFTTKRNGLGMGLPISQTIVEAHGGRLSAENNLAGGATFRFTVPVATTVPQS